MTCTPGQRTYSAFWLGIGGMRASSRRLEQAGTEADCTRAGTARYSAWYELVPHASVPLRLTIAPGDEISASVRISGARVTLSVVDRTTGASATKHLQFPHSDTTSAEWIAEAPSHRLSVIGCPVAQPKRRTSPMMRRTQKLVKPRMK